MLDDRMKVSRRRPGQDKTFVAALHPIGNHGAVSSATTASVTPSPSISTITAAASSISPSACLYSHCLFNLRQLNPLVTIIIRVVGILRIDQHDDDPHTMIHVDQLGVTAVLRYQCPFLHRYSNITCSCQ
jgi:hypothetical protein